MTWKDWLILVFLTLSCVVFWVSVAYGLDPGGPGGLFAVGVTVLTAAVWVGELRRR